MTVFTYHASPIGPLLLVGEVDGPGATGLRLTGVYMEEHRHAPAVPEGSREDAAPFALVVAQLDEYFAGRRETFDLPLAPSGTPFQLLVWDELTRIPAGTTISYGELARRIGRPGSGRAVGGAVGRNPISVVVPCHRVIGSDGSLTGFGGGLDRKRVLLDLERAERAAVGSR